MVVIAIGKAGTAMFEPLRETMIPGLVRGQMLRAVVVAPNPPVWRDARVRYFPARHPLPGPESLAAAQAILDLLQECERDCLILFLISGGASAMIEKPMQDTIGLDDTIRFYEGLIHSGLSIEKMNVLRKHFSQVKGGRLAVAAQGSRQCTLLISDVPGSALDVIGSGPTLPDPSTVEECRSLVEENFEDLRMPESVLSFFRGPQLDETPKESHAAFLRAGWISLLSSDDLYREAAGLATAAGFHVVVDNTCDDWDYRDAAAYLIERLTELRRSHGRVCLISVGELSVRLNDAPGMGGRNQQFVLECALRLAGGAPATVLSGGSDGVDGNSPAAGAVCDEKTVDRANLLGWDVQAALRGFDSFPLFEALGDHIMTGPTGNNLRDLRLLLTDDSEDLTG